MESEILFVERNGFYTIIDFYKSLGINTENGGERLISTLVNLVFVFKDGVDVCIALKGRVAHVGFGTEKSIVEIDASEAVFSENGSGGNIEANGLPIGLLPELFLVGDCFGFTIYPGKSIFAENKRG